MNGNCESGSRFCFTLSYMLLPQNFQEHTIDISKIDRAQILNQWIWLTGTDKQVAYITKLGDALLTDKHQQFYHLNTGEGTIEKIEELGIRDYEYIFLPELIRELEATNRCLSQNEVYSFTLLPVLGGTYSVSNMFKLDVYEHFGVTGEIHSQLKNLPDGTEVELHVTE